MKNNINIDDEAKLTVLLDAKEDAKDNVFYTGKLQFNGTLSLNLGQSFMIFTSEKGHEEMQIGPLLSSKTNKYKQNTSFNDSRISVRLKKHHDTYGKTFYVGELSGVGDLNVQNGIFFTIFTSIDGREELQISPLKIKPKKNIGQYEYDKVKMLA